MAWRWATSFFQALWPLFAEANAMTFIIIILILFGLTLIFSGIEKKSLAAYLQSWIGGGNATK